MTARWSRAERLRRDAACRLTVFQRDGFACIRCGSPFVEWAHVHSRAVTRLRWEPDNSFTACRRCHEWFDAHRKYGREVWWPSIIGEARAERLRRLIP